MAASLKATIELRGAEQVLKQLEGLGDAGKKAFHDIAIASQKAGGFDKLDPTKVQAQLKQLGLVGPEAFNKIKTAVEKAARFDLLINAISGAQAAFVRFGAIAARLGFIFGGVGLGAGAAALALGALGRGSAEVATKLGEAAAKAGLSVAEYQRLRLALQGTGTDGEKAEKVIGALADRMAKDAIPAFKQFAETTVANAKAGLHNVQALQQLQKEAVGTGEKAKIASEALKELGVSVAFPPSSLGKINAELARTISLVDPLTGKARALSEVIPDIIAAFKRLPDEAAKLNLAEKLVGKDFAPAFVKAFSTSLEAGQKFVRDMEAAGLALSAEQIATADRITAAWGRVATAGQLAAQQPGAFSEASIRLAGELERTITAIGQAMANPTFANFGNIFAQAFPDIHRGLQQVLQLWAQVNQEFSAGLNTSPAQQTLEALAQVAQSVFSRILQGVNEAKQGLNSGWDTSAAAQAIQFLMGLIDRLISKFKELFASKEAALSTAGAPSLSDTGGFAAGGHVGGRGTGTSDSNLAWLSRGEYIIPARAVAQPGVLAFLEALRRTGGDLGRALRGLRGFSLGGLVPDLSASVGSLIPAYAEGGPVGPKFGTLVLQMGQGGPQVSVMAQSGAVAELTRFASSTQRASLGRKPSRYGH